VCSSDLNTMMYYIWLIVSLVFLWVPYGSCQSAAGQETLVGIVGRNFVVLGADSSVSTSIAFTASDLDKIAILDGQATIAAAAAGDAADSDRLLGILSAHCAIREYEEGGDVDFYMMNENDKLPERPIGLTVQEVAHLARNQIASSLRSRSQLKVCLLIAGMMKSEGIEPESFSKRLQSQASGNTGTASFTSFITNDVNTSASLRPHLFWLDPYGSLQKVQYGAHGHGANFMLSILDQSYQPDLSQEEAIQIVRDCFDQLRIRYVINTPQPPCIKCIDKDGCRLIR